MKKLIIINIVLLFIMMMSFGCGKSNSVDNVDNNDTTDYERITVHELKKLIDSQADIVIVDVRGKQSYDISHIPDALWMSYPDGLREKVNQLPEDKDIILYCS
ncbi:hypothetical protein GF312_21325 [Candidatus Poribacteria bacterium]|nr:hypothetical protein [Candidatus Poribacteria bacterium]